MVPIYYYNVWRASLGRRKQAGRDYQLYTAWRSIIAVRGRGELYRSIILHRPLPSPPLTDLYSHHARGWRDNIITQRLPHLIHITIYRVLAEKSVTSSDCNLLIIIIFHTFEPGAYDTDLKFCRLFISGTGSPSRRFNGRHFRQNNLRNVSENLYVYLYVFLFLQCIYNLSVGTVANLIKRDLWLMYLHKSFDGSSPHPLTALPISIGT